MVTFTNAPKNWTIHGKDHLNIVGIETKGKDLDDMLANCELYVETWYGYPCEMSIDDLPAADYDEVIRMFNERLQEVA